LFLFFKSSCKKQIWIRVHFLFQVKFGFGSFFRVFEAMNKFIMVSKVFRVKRTLSPIFRPPQWLKYEQNRQRVVCSFFFKKNKVDDMSFALRVVKKRAQLQVCQHVGLNEMGQAQQRLTLFFLFFLFQLMHFFIFLKKLNYIYINTHSLFYFI